MLNSYGSTDNSFKEEKGFVSWKKLRTLEEELGSVSIS